MLEGGFGGQFLGVSPKGVREPAAYQIPDAADLRLRIQPAVWTPYLGIGLPVREVQRFAVMRHGGGEQSAGGFAAVVVPFAEVSPSERVKEPIGGVAVFSG